MANNNILSYRCQLMKDSLLDKCGKLFKAVYEHHAYVSHDLFGPEAKQSRVKFELGETFMICTVTDYGDPEGQRVIDALGFSISDNSEVLILKVLVGSRIRYIQLDRVSNIVQNPYSIIEGHIRIYEEIDHE